MARNHKGKVEKDTSERWLLTYSDLMNLLLILFIILYTMSKVDVAKYQQVAQSLRAALGDRVTNSIIGEGGAGSSMVPLDSNAPSPVIPANMEEQQMEAVKDKVSELIKKENLNGEVEVTLEERGIVISIRAQVAFKPGSADIEPEAKKTILDIGKILQSVPGNQIRVEGHTDTDPINTPRFPSNWELSGARAVNVLRLLVDGGGISPKIISAVGYGEYRPKVPNTTPANKAINRRVNIVIVKNLYDKAEAGISKPVEVKPAGGQEIQDQQTVSPEGNH